MKYKHAYIGDVSQIEEQKDILNHLPLKWVVSETTYEAISRRHYYKNEKYYAILVPIRGKASYIFRPSLSKLMHALTFIYDVKEFRDLNELTNKNQSIIYEIF
jgi:hypothetical protein